MTNSFVKCMLAVGLLSLSLSASARDRDYAGGWRLGLGHDHYGIYHHDGRSWRRVPGSATAVGDGWVIGTDRRHGGFGIYRWNGYGWIRMPGAAVSIGGSYERPWVINNRGEKFYWNGYDWDAAWDGGRHDRYYREEPRGNAYHYGRDRDRGRERERYRNNRGRW